MSHLRSGLVLFVQSGSWPSENLNNTSGHRGHSLLSFVLYLVAINKFFVFCVNSSFHVHVVHNVAAWRRHQYVTSSRTVNHRQYYSTQNTHVLASLAD